MPRRHKYVIVLACSAALLIHQRSVLAQGESLSLTRAQAQERALARSTELARRVGARREAGRLARVAYPFNPGISFEMEGANSPWSSAEYTRRVTLEQELDLRGERRARSRVGEAAIGVTERELGERSQAIAADVDRAYSRHLVARRKTALFEPLRQRARDLRAKVETARRRETVTGFDARLLRSEALSLEADWLGARRDLETTEAQLRVLLALAPDSALSLEDDLDDRSWRCDADSTWTMAQHRRVAMARAAAAESMAVARLALEQRLAGINPTVGASLGRERTELEFGAPMDAISAEATLVGLHVRVPLPLFRVNATGIAEARLELERVRAERAALEREVRQEVVAACAGLHRVQEERRLRTEAAESAARDLELIESAYEGGRIPLDEYLTLRERLVRQQVALLEAAGALEEERARLVQATGVPREELAPR